MTNVELERIVAAVRERYAFVDEATYDVEQRAAVTVRELRALLTAVERATHDRDRAHSMSENCHHTLTYAFAQLNEAQFKCADLEDEVTKVLRERDEAIERATKEKAEYDASREAFVTELKRVNDRSCAYIERLVKERGEVHDAWTESMSRLESKHALAMAWGAEMCDRLAEEREAFADLERLYDKRELR